jgi:hypothetical protein
LIEPIGCRLFTSSMAKSNEPWWSKTIVKALGVILASGLLVGVYFNSTINKNKVEADTANAAQNTTFSGSQNQQVIGSSNVQVSNVINNLTNSTQINAQGSTFSVNMPKRDVIEGTQMTHGEVKDLFPFGYLIISKRDGKWTYEPAPHGGIQWDIDAIKKTVRIEPDFTSGMVEWTFPMIRAEKSANGRVAAIENNFLNLTTPMATDEIYDPLFIRFEKEPSLHIGTFGSNQAAPVFGIGFRIPRMSKPPFPQNQ